ncbi:ABC transporter permease [Acidisoma silvae]|uniref:ABC transporter permease n=1 Tax=Acidisoma silvae TaxID=2802396 RepID=UPI001D0AB1D9|nr:ABC transporter permease [Acidisoma silvae]
MSAHTHKPAQTELGTKPRPHIGKRGLHGFLRVREASILVVAILLIIYFESTNVNFLTDANLQTLSQFISPWVVIACGEIMLLICGEIDLSAGMVFALAPFIMYFAHDAGLPLIIAFILAIIGCGAIGFFNGFVSVKLRVPSFVVTLGTMFLINGFTLTISRGFPVDTPNDGIFSFLMGGGYAEITWAVILVLFMHGMLRNTRWGLHTIAVGGNLLGSAESGINVTKIKIGNFVITGALAGLAGILEASRIGSTDPLAGGSNMMFMAVAAAVIGGTSLMGGSGTIIGGLFGGLMLGVLQDGFTINGINAFTFDMIIGAAILIAMVFNIHFARLRNMGKLK